MRIAFISPASINGESGSSRIFRTLQETAPEDVKIYNITTTVGHIKGWPQIRGSFEEYFLPWRPSFGRIERSRFDGMPNVLGSMLWGEAFKNGLREFLKESKIEVINAHSHGIEFWWAFEVAQGLKIPYYLTCHDLLEYNLSRWANISSVNSKLCIVWREAKRRFVISKELGEEYCRRFGRKDYIVVTDGIEGVKVRSEKSISEYLIYFLGSQHVSYEKNFVSIFEALSIFNEKYPQRKVKLLTRPPLQKSWANFENYESRPFGSESDIAADLEEVHLLYQPLPFEEKFASLSRYSLSTKMITYLGSGIPILFHGPQNSAASRCLDKAAFQVHSCDPVEVFDVIENGLLENSLRGDVLLRAESIVNDRFLLGKVSNAFWGTISSADQNVG
jgi:glycosyltransferase involved in cell wall biosynthesis